MSRSKHICLINRNYPPIPGATGYYAAQLVDHLRSKAHKLTIISTGDDPTPEHQQIKPSYSGKVKWRRLYSSFTESYRLIKTANQVKEVDIYIVMSDPSFLNYWAARLFKQKPWIYWSMDVFPAAFIANGLVGHRNIFVQRFLKTISSNPPVHTISLGDHQSQFLKTQGDNNDTFTVIPIGVTTHPGQIKKPNQAITFGYVGTVGEAHDVGLITQVLASLSAANHKVIVRAMGSKSDALISAVSHLNGVKIYDYVDDKTMQSIDVQIVSLQQKWTHISVPSKALTAVCHGSAVLYLGSDTSDTWQYIQEAAWQIHHKKDIPQVLDQISVEEVYHKKLATKKISANLTNRRDRGFAEIEKYIAHLDITTDR